MGYNARCYLPALKTSPYKTSRWTWKIGSYKTEIFLKAFIVYYLKYYTQEYIQPGKNT